MVETCSMTDLSDTSSSHSLLVIVSDCHAVFSVSVLASARPPARSVFWPWCAACAGSLLETKSLADVSSARLSTACPASPTDMECSIGSCASRAVQPSTTRGALCTELCWRRGPEMRLRRKRQRRRKSRRSRARASDSARLGQCPPLGQVTAVLARASASDRCLGRCPPARLALSWPVPAWPWPVPACLGQCPPLVLLTLTRAVRDSVMFFMFDIERHSRTMIRSLRPSCAPRSAESL